MFPGVDGFHWTFAHIFFISVFLEHRELRSLPWRVVSLARSRGAMS